MEAGVLRRLRHSWVCHLAWLALSTAAPGVVSAGGLRFLSTWQPRVVRQLLRQLMAPRESGRCQVDTSRLLMTWRWKSPNIPSAILYKLRRQKPAQDQGEGAQTPPFNGRSIKHFGSCAFGRPHHPMFQGPEFLRSFSRESHLEKSLQVYLHQKPTSINQS